MENAAVGFLLSFSYKSSWVKDSEGEQNSIMFIIYLYIQEQQFKNHELDYLIIL